MTDDERRAAREAIIKAFVELGAVCSEGPSRRFRMTIPYDRERDTDSIIHTGLKEGRKALDYSAALERKNDELAKLLAQTVDFTYGELYVTIKAALGRYTPS